MSALSAGGAGRVPLQGRTWSRHGRDAGWGWGTVVETVAETVASRRPDDTGAAGGDLAAA